MERKTQQFSVFAADDDDAAFSVFYKRKERVGNMIVADYVNAHASLKFCGRDLDK